MYTVGKKLSKWVYTPLKAGFLQMFQIFLFCETLLYYEMTIFHFFRVQGERHVWMTSIEIITIFREVFSWFDEDKNNIKISSVKNSLKFFWPWFNPFDFLKWQENIWHSRSKRRSYGHAILLFIKNIIKYEIRFLSS